MRQTSPSSERNKAPILAVLQRVLPPSGRMLEIASGSGQHAAHFAAALPGWHWQPSDPDAAARASTNDWAATANAPGLQPALALDVLDRPWPVDGPFDAVFSANMLHISPWATCAALMQGAAQVLAPEGLLITYGPYFVQGEPPAPGNTAFDADLRARNPAWGIRWLQQVLDEARQAGLALRERVAMPANNLMLVLARV